MKTLPLLLCMLTAVIAKANSEVVLDTIDTAYSLNEVVITGTRTAKLLKKHAGTDAVIVFWSFIEIVARNGVILEIWVTPLRHVPQLVTLLLCIMAFPVCYLLRKSLRR